MHMLHDMVSLSSRTGQHNTLYIYSTLRCFCREPFMYLIEWNKNSKSPEPCGSELYLKLTDFLEN